MEEIYELKIVNEEMMAFLANVKAELSNVDTILNSLMTKYFLGTQSILNYCSQ